jgi:hypothetical protein
VTSRQDRIVHLEQELRGERALRRQFEAEVVWLRARLNAYLAAEMIELQTEILERRSGNLHIVHSEK